MSDMLQKVLSDASARSANALPVVAAESASKFLPWATVE